MFATSQQCLSPMLVACRIGILACLLGNKLKHSFIGDFGLCAWEFNEEGLEKSVCCYAYFVSKLIQTLQTCVNSSMAAEAIIVALPQMINPKYLTACLDERMVK
ncbi:hypothetical protein VNO80_29336 [Phaseolus coccineus]|uniref:Uncharacterized protein n=1 Tax=Phaseolus coccineus TaxID=3886 RepID=A0AAN9QID9_PHACN